MSVISAKLLNQDYQLYKKIGNTSQLIMSTNQQIQ